MNYEGISLPGVIGPHHASFTGRFWGLTRALRTEGMHMTTAPQPHGDDSDDAHLATLGYQSEFKRDMSLWANFSLGFTYLSPVVGIYTVFAFALAAAGPPM